MKYQVWLEGYAASGDSSTAYFVGEFEGESFEQACATAAKQLSEPKLYDPKRNTYWGCSFYDNEKDARKSFG